MRVGPRIGIFKAREGARATAAHSTVPVASGFMWVGPRICIFKARVARATAVHSAVPVASGFSWVGGISDPPRLKLPVSYYVLKDSCVGGKKSQAPARRMCWECQRESRPNECGGIRWCGEGVSAPGEILALKKRRGSGAAGAFQPVARGFMRVGPRTGIFKARGGARATAAHSTVQIRLLIWASSGRVVVGSRAQDLAGVSLHRGGRGACTVAGGEPAPILYLKFRVSTC